MTKARAKQTTSQAKERWILTDVPKSLQQAVIDAASEEGVSVGQFVEQALKSHKMVRKPRIDASKIKNIKDVAGALNKLERRLQAVENAPNYVHLKQSYVTQLAEKVNIKDLYEKTHIKDLYEKTDFKEIYAKGNSMMSKVYQYAKNKCIGNPKSKRKKK